MADQTAQELIKEALDEIGVIATGETPSDDDMQLGLRRMKIMFRTWAAHGMMIYTTTIDTHTLTSGTTNYTIGTAGTIATERPASIRSAFITQNNLDYNLDIISEEEYTAFCQKTLGYDYPAALWYKPTYPNGTIYLWPPGGGTLNLHSMKLLSEPSALTTSVAFPGEYDEAIIYNLAKRLAGSFGAILTPLQMQMAEDSLDNVINYNSSLNIGIVKTEILGLNRRWHINEG
jgi:hypothetical protein